MVETKKLFQLIRQFPAYDSILSKREKSIDEIFKNAIFVLDTNSLLAPFQTGKDDIEGIRIIYTKLISETRLFIPEHSLREFAKNRSTKISELYSNIDNFLSEIPSIKTFEYPIL